MVPLQVAAARSHGLRPPRPQRHRRVRSIIACGSAKDSEPPHPSDAEAQHDSYKSQLLAAVDKLRPEAGWSFKEEDDEEDDAVWGREAAEGTDDEFFFVVDEDDEEEAGLLLFDKDIRQQTFGMGRETATSQTRSTEQGEGQETRPDDFTASPATTESVASAGNEFATSSEDSGLGEVEESVSAAPGEADSCSPEEAAVLVEVGASADFWESWTVFMQLLKDQKHLLVSSVDRADYASMKKACLSLGRTRPDMLFLLPHESIAAFVEAFALEKSAPRKLRNALRRLQDAFMLMLSKTGYGSATFADVLRLLLHLSELGREAAEQQLPGAVTSGRKLMPDIVRCMQQPALDDAEVVAAARQVPSEHGVVLTPHVAVKQGNTGKLDVEESEAERLVEEFERGLLERGKTGGKGDKAALTPAAAVDMALKLVNGYGKGLTSRQHARRERREARSRLREQEAAAAEAGQGRASVTGTGDGPGPLELAMSAVDAASAQQKPQKPQHEQPELQQDEEEEGRREAPRAWSPWMNIDSFGDDIDTSPPSAASSTALPPQRKQEFRAGKSTDLHGSAQGQLQGSFRETDGKGLGKGVNGMAQDRDRGGQEALARVEGSSKGTASSAADAWQTRLGRGDSAVPGARTATTSTGRRDSWRTDTDPGGRGGARTAPGGQRRGRGGGGRDHTETGAGSWRDEGGRRDADLFHGTPSWDALAETETFDQRGGGRRDRGRGRGSPDRGGCHSTRHDPQTRSRGQGRDRRGGRGGGQWDRESDALEPSERHGRDRRYSGSRNSRPTSPASAHRGRSPGYTPAEGEFDIITGEPQ